VDGSVILWDARTATKLLTFRGHAGVVSSVSFGPDARLALTGSRDGTARLWDVCARQELARLVCLGPEEDWFVATPEGLFDGSTRSRNKVSFRTWINGEWLVVPVDRFFRDFYYPGLLAEIWQGKRPMPDKELGRNPAPELQILLRDPAHRDSNQVLVDVAVTDQGGGIQEPWLFHNGLRTGEPEDVSKHGNKLQCSFRVSLMEGENRIEVQSASEDGSWESEPAVVTMDYDGTLRLPELHLLVIAINEYEGGDNLRGCVPTGKRITDLCKNYHAQRYTTVHPTALYDAEATVDGMTDAIEAIGEQAGPQDTLVVYVAGHGWTIGQRYYLLPHEYQQTEGQTINQAVRQWGLPIDELGSKLSQVPALKRVLIFDTCMSGSVAKSKRSPFEFRGAVERFARSQGIFTLAASAEDAAAFEHPMTGDMGILTFILLAGMGAVEDKHELLKGARVKSDGPKGEVDVLDWFHFAEQHMPELAKKLAGQKDYHVEMRGREPSFTLLRSDNH